MYEIIIKIRCMNRYINIQIDGVSLKTLLIKRYIDKTQPHETLHP